MKGKKDKTIEKFSINMFYTLVPNKKWKIYIKKYLFIFIDNIMNKKK